MGNIFFTLFFGFGIKIASVLVKILIMAADDPDFDLAGDKIVVVKKL